MGTVFKAMWKFLKTYPLHTLCGVLIIAFLVVGTFTKKYYNKYTTEKEKKEQYQSNLYTTNEELEVSKNKNNDYIASAKAMKINIDELELVNKTLAKDLKASNVKYDKLLAASISNIEYNILKDSLDFVTEKLGIIENELNKENSIHQFSANYKDSYIDVNQTINVTENLDSISIHSFDAKIKDEISTAVEPIYKKKCWLIFWKKKKIIGAKVHQISKNPYYHIEKMENYIFED